MFSGRLSQVYLQALWPDTQIIMSKAVTFTSLMSDLPVDATGTCYPKASAIVRASWRMMVRAGRALRHLVIWSASTREFKDQLKAPPPAINVITNSYSLRVVCHIRQMEFKPPSTVGKVLHGEAELLDTEPFADAARHRQKGPLLHCQDNATAAIVKSQGYCVGPRSTADTQRHTPAQTHTKNDREMWQNWTLLLLWRRRTEKKKRRDRGGEQKRSVSKNTSERPDQRQRRKEKHVCREGEKNKIINSE